MFSRSFLFHSCLTEKSMVVIMEFFDGYELLDHVLVDKAKWADLDSEPVASSLGDRVGFSHVSACWTARDATFLNCFIL